MLKTYWHPSPAGDREYLVIRDDDSTPTSHTPAKLVRFSNIYYGNYHIIASGNFYDLLEIADKLNHGEAVDLNV